ncbi:hypothetical protein [Tahibacter amnicola]|uniref:Uncharacterized protein n=1 Tax=Tahibacter amnicola TaxID=2976241 RepID=A0ABY6BHB0_9GAMM|nr:hypothetical protein [Tahibacter amnicola]UXI68465.1 hypothetical protein N4264_02085 [Tahibacter amnicola]
MRSIGLIGGLLVSTMAFGLEPPAREEPAPTQEERISRMMQQPAASPAPPAAPKAAAKPARKGKAAAPDPHESLIGQNVAVETGDRGLYLGVLTAVSKDALTLEITLPTRRIAFPIARSSVARVTPR